MPRATEAAEIMDDHTLRDGLVQMSFAVMSILNRVGAQYDLSVTHIRVLGILVDRKVKMAELAGYLGLDRSSISGLIDRAESRGFVQRESSPDDGRSIRVALTADGRRMAADVGHQIRQGVATLVDGLTANEQQRLGALLHKAVAFQE